MKIVRGDQCMSKMKLSSIYTPYLEHFTADGTSTNEEVIQIE